MKNMLLLLLLAFISGNAIGQTTEFKDLVLSVGKKPTNSQTSSLVILKFKPEESLRIKTLDGRKLVSDKYFLDENTILMIRQTRNEAIVIDTIFLQDIASIRGKVFGDTDRKLVGGIIAITGVPLGIFPVFISVFSGGPAFLVAMPFVGISIAGISMIGSRRFNTTDRWELKIIDR
jgi:hypothetical protein